MSKQIDIKQRIKVKLLDQCKQILIRFIYFAREF